MKNNYITWALLLALLILNGCTATRTSMIGDAEKKGWSEFVGQEVTELITVYPEGDTPRNLIITKDLEKNILRGNNAGHRAYKSIVTETNSTISRQAVNLPEEPCA